MPSENDDPRVDILEATYRALCQEGYAELTLEDISAEFGRSKGTIFYYFDSKADLFTSFLEFLYKQYADRLDEVSGGPPRDRLDSLLEVALANDEPAAGQEFRTAMLEVSAQAPYDESIQSELERFDDLLFEHFREIIADGIQSGDFDERVDPGLAAEFLVTTISGAQTRRVSVDRSTGRLVETITRYAELLLLDRRPGELSQ